MRLSSAKPTPHGHQSSMAFPLTMGHHATLRWCVMCVCVCANIFVLEPHLLFLRSLTFYVIVPSCGLFSSLSLLFSLRLALSQRDYAVTGPWPTYPTANRSTSAFVAVNPSGSGPGPDDIPGCVGPQVVSTKRNAPIAAFGKSERFHHKTETKPGPGEYDTTHIEAMGNAGVTLKPGSPSWSLGLKLDSTIYKNMPIDTPGPKYDAHKALEMGGHLDLSHSAAVDHAPRMSRKKDNGVPGPGNYKNVVSIGKQKLSQFVTEPTIKFTKKLRLSDLPNGDPVFISHQHSSENIGKHGPGPAVHVGRMTCDGSLFIGGSLDTKYGTKTRPIGFCKEKKLRPQSTEGFWNPNNPGPGAYTTTTSIGKQVQSKNPTSPCASKTTMERAVWDKQFLSAEHLKVESQGKDSPGPMYEPVVTSKGACLVSASKCGAPFGKGKRDATDLRISSPGPAAYSISRDFDERLPSPQKIVGRGAEKGSSFGNEKRPCLQVSFFLLLCLLPSS